MNKTRRFNRRYLPKQLKGNDRTKQYNELKKSINMYKNHKYYTRKKIPTFHSKPSKHIITAKKIYNVDVIGANKDLSNASGCSIQSLKQIIRKGEGAYYSSGSRPNQTAQSWGIARLASALTSGKASAVDYTILAKGCKSGSVGLKYAKIGRRKYGTGTRRVPKANI